MINKGRVVKAERAKRLLDEKRKESYANFVKGLSEIGDTGSRNRKYRATDNLNYREKEYWSEQWFKESGSAQRHASIRAYNESGLYAQWIHHYATVLKYAYLIIPRAINNGNLDFSGKKAKKLYAQTVQFIDDLNIPSLGKNIAFQTLLNGVCYVGVLRDPSTREIAFIQLPNHLCRTQYDDIRGIGVVEINFGLIALKENYQYLSVCPLSVIEAFDQWDKEKALTPAGTQSDYWYEISPEDAAAFYLFTKRPYFLNALEGIIGKEKGDARQADKELKDLEKIVVQEIGHLSDGTLLFEPDEVAEMHRGLSNMLSDVPNTSAITSYGNVEIKDMTSTDANSAASAKQRLNNAYAEAGVSPETFTTTSSASLARSLEQDAAIMMVLAEKVADFLTSIINGEDAPFAGANIEYRIKILPVTPYNKADYVKSALSTATLGYSWLHVSAAQGITQSEIVDLKKLETEGLGLLDLFIPLSSSYTQGAEASPLVDEGGRPEKSDDDKAQKTNINIESKDKTGGVE